MLVVAAEFRNPHVDASLEICRAVIETPINLTPGRWV
jgi:hypothetical protein